MVLPTSRLKSVHMHCMRVCVYEVIKTTGIRESLGGSANLSQVPDEEGTPRLPSPASLTHTMSQPRHLPGCLQIRDWYVWRQVLPAHLPQSQPQACHEHLCQRHSPALKSLNNLVSPPNTEEKNKNNLMCRLGG